MANQVKQVQVIERSEVKRTGLVLYKVLSSNGQDTYYVTIQGDEVFCECQGFNGRYEKCYHSRELMAAECEKRGEAKLAAFKAGMEAQYAQAPSAVEIKPVGLAESYQVGWYPKTSL